MAKKTSKLEKEIISGADEKTVKKTAAPKPAPVSELPEPESENVEVTEDHVHVPEDLDTNLLESSDVPVLSLIETIDLEISHAINQLSVKRINQLSEQIIGYDNRVRFKDYAGRTHYKFLHALSTYFNNSVIYDGTEDPLNGLALAYNTSNTVHCSSDILSNSQKIIRKIPSNLYYAAPDEIFAGRIIASDSTEPEKSKSIPQPQYCICLLSSVHQYQHLLLRKQEFRGSIIVVLGIATENSPEKELWGGFPDANRLDMSKYVGEIGAGIIVL